MDPWDNTKLNPSHHRGNNPSFSSTLLDNIYRSIDDDDHLVRYTETMRKKRTTTPANPDMASIQRACMIESWIEKKKVTSVRRESSVAAPEFPTKKSRSHRNASTFWSSSSSSDSSSGGCLSSSELDSVVNGAVSSSSAASASSSCFNPHRPKPIRTSLSVNENTHHMFDKCSKPKQHENGFVKTKSKAMKIYGDLKKAKQPISPGGRLATFLNSLFTAGTIKKPKISSPSTTVTFEEMSSKSAYTSTCSSTSSFSRSCLSKTPSSRGKLSNGTKRSVTFHPVSVIVGEDCRPCGQKSLDHLTNTADSDEIRLRIMEKHRHVEEVARDMLRNYQKKVEYEFNSRNAGPDDMYVEIEYDDDAASDASSDLFELDNLSSIGIDRYREELPVYETTHLGTNRAIASGLIS